MSCYPSLLKTACDSRPTAWSTLVGWVANCLRMCDAFQIADRSHCERAKILPRRAAASVQKGGPRTISTGVPQWRGSGVSPQICTVRPEKEGPAVATVKPALLSNPRVRRVSFSSSSLSCPSASSSTPAPPLLTHSGCVCFTCIPLL